MRRQCVGVFTVTVEAGKQIDRLFLGGLDLSAFSTRRRITPMDFIILLGYLSVMLLLSFIFVKIVHAIFGDFEGTYGGH